MCVLTLRPMLYFGRLPSLRFSAQQVIGILISSPFPFFPNGFLIYADRFVTVYIPTPYIFDILPFPPMHVCLCGGLEIQEQKLKNAWPFAWGPPRILSCDRPNPPKPRGPSRRKAFVGRARRLGGKSFFLTVIHTGRWAHVPVGRASLAAKFGLWRDGSWTEGLASSIVSWMDWPLQWYCNCR